MNPIVRRLRRAIRQIVPRKEHVEVSGSIIPPPDRRWGGQEFMDDNYYLASTEREARRLVAHFKCTDRSRILDVGCGPGRLPIGILRVIGELDYTGVDLDKKSIEWCRRFIQQDHPSFVFRHLDLYNERYNRDGTSIHDGFRFDVDTGSMDVVYLYSVFSHTTEHDMRVYLKDFARILSGSGGIFFTTFVEEDVPDISINPHNYRVGCSGPLHVVRYRKEHLFGIVDELGYSVVDFTYGTEADGQSAIYLARKARGPVDPSATT